MHGAINLSGFVVITICLCAGKPALSSKAAEQEIIQGIDLVQTQREERLADYSVVEHYVLRNSRFNAPAETTVATIYVRGAGKTFRVISKSGPDFLHTHVLEKILKEEAEMSRGEQRKSALVISANYAMKLVGEDTVNGRRCGVMELIPRKKSSHLLKGKAWVDAENQAIVRIKGKPTASPAFLAGRPEIVRDYINLDGFSMAHKSHAHSETLLLGRTDLIVDYTNYRVNTGKLR